MFATASPPPADAIATLPGNNAGSIESTSDASIPLAFHTPFLLNAVYVFVGEVVVLEIGAFLFGLLEKNESVLKIIKA